MWWLAVAAGFLVALLIFGIGPTMAAGASFLALAAIAVAFRPRLLVYATFVLAFITLPTAIPTTFAIGLISFRAYEATLVFAAVYLLAAVKTSPAANRLALLIAALAGGGVVLGLARGNAVGDITTDVRWLIIMLLGFVTASRVVRTTMTATLLKLLPWVLWVSAAFLLAGSLFALPLAGRTEQASLSNIGDLNEATRLLTPTNFLALVVLCGVIALGIAGRATFRGTLKLTAPALLIIVLAFSRNSLVGLAAAVAFALLVSWSVRAFMKVISIGAAVVVASAILVAGAPVIAQLPGGTWVNLQVASYTSRVIDGLNPETQAVDPSAQFREANENQRLIPHIQQSPVFGHGFGFAYKAPSGEVGTFERDLAYLYAHNYYLWLAAKTGLLGLGVFLFFIAWPIVQTFRRRTSQNIALTAGGVALATCSIVAPMANGSPTSVLLGALVGAVAGLAVSPGPDASEREPRHTRRSAHSPESRQLRSR